MKKKYAPAPGGLILARWSPELYHVSRSHPGLFCKETEEPGVGTPGSGIP